MRTTKLLALLAAFAANSAFGGPVRWWSKSVEENLANLSTPSKTNPFAVTDNLTIKSTSGESARGVDWPDNYILQLTITGNEPLMNDSGSIISTVSAWSLNKYEIGIQVGVQDNDSVRWCNPVFDNDGYTDVILSTGDDFWLNRGIQFSLGHPDDSQAIIVELGYYDENYNFFGIAKASGTFGGLNDHMYRQGDIGPPHGDWNPSPFILYAVPEPSTAFLAVLGTLSLLKRRKQ